MIDTANKRFSLLQMGRPWVVALPVPNGGLTAQDRRLLAHFYAGELEDVGGVLPFCRATLRLIEEAVGVLRLIEEETGVLRS